MVEWLGGICPGSDPVSSANTGAELPLYASVAYEGALLFHIQNPSLSARISMNSAIYIAYKWSYQPGL